MEDNMTLNDSELENVSGGVIGDTGLYYRYRIVRGDNLTKIARRYNTTVDVLVRINGIRDRNKIYAGEYLLIPVTR